MSAESLQKLLESDVRIFNEMLSSPETRSSSEKTYINVRKTIASEYLRELLK